MELRSGLRQDARSLRGQDCGEVGSGGPSPLLEGLEHILIWGGDPVSLWRGWPNWAMAVAGLGQKPKDKRPPGLPPAKDRDARAIARADHRRRIEQFRAR